MNESQAAKFHHVKRSHFSRLFTDSRRRNWKFSKIKSIFNPFSNVICSEAQRKLLLSRSQKAPASPHSPPKSFAAVRICSTMQSRPSGILVLSVLFHLLCVLSKFFIFFELNKNFLCKILVNSYQGWSLDFGYWLQSLKFRLLFRFQSLKSKLLLFHSTLAVTCPFSVFRECEFQTIENAFNVLVIKGGLLRVV